MYITEQYIVNELSFKNLLFSASVRSFIRTNNIRIISKKEFLNEIRPGDILVTSYKKSRGVVGSVKSNMIKMAQHVPLTSSKIVLDKNEIGGFGVVPAKPQVLLTTPAKKFVMNFHSAVVCRLNNLSEKEQTIIINFIRKRVGKIDYDTKGLLKSAWKRFINNYNYEMVNYKKYIDPLFCSTLIQYAYLSANKSYMFSHSPDTTWPRDFIDSDKLDKIGAFVGREGN